MTAIQFLLIGLPALLKIGYVATAVVFHGAKWNFIFTGYDIVFIPPVAFLAVFSILLRLTSRVKSDGSEISVQMMLGIILWVWVLSPFLLRLMF